MSLKLTWKRVKEDEKERIFMQNIHELELIDEDIDGWIGILEEKIKNGTYNPSPSHIYDIPKPNFLIRPGSHLTLNDRIVFTHIVGEILKNISETLSWSQHKVDFSNIISDKLDDIKWLKNPFIGWDQFRKESLKRIETGYSYVVMTDITGYYENIDISILMSDLRAMSIDNQLLKLLDKCLRKWSPTGTKGIPQGHAASDILSKVYLNNIDHNLINQNYDHLRYSDDIRIFCKSHPEAKKAIAELSSLLRLRGLNLQSAKTQILLASDAKKRIEELTESLINVDKKLPQEIYKITGLGNPSMSRFEIKEILTQNKKSIQIELVRDTYKNYFINSQKEFNKTLFHYLLALLGESKDKFAIDSCIQFLESHPEETENILDYFTAINCQKDVEQNLAIFLNSDHKIYHYQVYLIVKWFYEWKNKPCTEIITICRKLAFDMSIPAYLRSFARALVSNYGNNADLEKIGNFYSETEHDLEKAQIICSLVKMESARRNSFFSRVKDDGELQKRAVRFVKSKLQPQTLNTIKKN